MSWAGCERPQVARVRVGFCCPCRKCQLRRSEDVSPTAANRREKWRLTLYSELSTIVLKMEFNMLEALYVSKSRIRKDLLALFFSNPSQRYYLRELERILGYSAGSIRRELLRFQTDNLFVTNRLGHMLYYSLNTEHPLFGELKGIVSKTVGVTGALRTAVVSVKGIRLAFIYGSFASGRQNAGSDVDLMIIGEPDVSELNEKIAGLERRLRREINPTVYSLRQYRAQKKAAGGFVKEVLRAPKTMLVGEEDDL